MSSGQHVLNRPATPWRHVIFGLRVILAVLFLGAAVSNVAGLPAVVTEFQTIGLGDGFRYLTAALQCLGAILLMLPRAALGGGVILLGIGVGAGWAQLAALRGDVIHVVVLLIAIAIVAAWDLRARLLQSAATAA